MFDEFFDEFVDGGRVDALGYKRHLAAEYGLDVTVTEVRTHVDEHVSYSIDVGVEGVGDILAEEWPE